MSKNLTVRLDNDLADWLKSEAKKQGKTQTELVEQALNNMRFGERQGDDKLSEIWNDNGRIIVMLNQILTGDMAQQLAFIYGKVLGKNAPKHDPEMMPKNVGEMALVLGSEKPHLLMHQNNFERAKAIFNYWNEWRTAGNAMPQMPQF